MLKEVTRYDFIWAYLAAGLNIGAGLILLPLILRFLTADEVGVWLVFLTLAGVGQLLELGFQPTLARNFAYVESGAKSLKNSDLPDVASSNSISLVLRAQLIQASKEIYSLVALGSAVVLLFGGTIYLSSVIQRSQTSVILLAWVLYASGVILNFYYGYINGALQGHGSISASNKIVVLSRFSFILLAGAALFFGYGLLGLGISSLLAAGISRAFAFTKFKAAFGEVDSKRLSKIEIKSLKKTLWHSASRLGIVQVGTFLIQRASVLVATSLLGLSVAASYGITLQIMTTISGLAMVICHLQLPRMSSLQANSSKNELSYIFGEIQLLSLILFAVGATALSLFGGALLSIIGSNTRLIADHLLILLSLVMLLELNHSVAATYLTTTNKIPFVASAIYSGLLILVLSIVLGAKFGLVGLITSQGLVQLAYNNWKWPRAAYNDLNIDLHEAMARGYSRIISRLKK